MACHPVNGFLCDSMCGVYVTRERINLPQCWSHPLSFVAIESVMQLQLELAVTINCPAQQTPGHGHPSLPNRLNGRGMWRLYTFPAGIHVTVTCTCDTQLGFTACVMGTVWDGNNTVAYSRGLLSGSAGMFCSYKSSLLPSVSSLLLTLTHNLYKTLLILSPFFL